MILGQRIRLDPNAEVPDRRYSLEKLEKSLCDAVVPFASRNDLSAKLRKGKEAAGL